MLDLIYRIFGHRAVSAALVTVLSLNASPVYGDETKVEILEPADAADDITVSMMNPKLVVYVKFSGSAMPSSAVARLTYFEDNSVQTHASDQIPQGIADHPVHGQCWKMEIPIDYKQYTGANLRVSTINTEDMTIV